MSSRHVNRGRLHRTSGRWGRRWLAICLFCLGSLPAGLFTSCSSAGPGGAAGLSDSSRSKAVCWLVFDYDSLFCSPCLAPLFDFCRSLPVAVQEKRVWGILVSAARPDRNRDGRHARIIRNKISGFAKANDLRFPIVLDGLHVFDSLVKPNISALLFNETHRTVKAYAFPLKPEEKAEIMQQLSN